MLIPFLRNHVITFLLCWQFFITPCWSMDPEDFSSPPTQKQTWKEFLGALLFPAPEEDDDWQRQLEEEEKQEKKPLTTQLTNEKTDSLSTSPFPNTTEPPQKTEDLLSLKEPENSPQTLTQIQENKEEEPEKINFPDSPLLNELKQHSLQYTEERDHKATSTLLPQSLTITPFTAASDPDLNDLYRMIADNFYETYLKPECFNTQQREALSWLADKIEKKKNEKTDLEQKNTERNDGILKTLESPIQQLQRSIEAYESLFKEVFYDLNQTRVVMDYTQQAIKATEKAITDLQAIKEKETNPQLTQTHEEQINVLKDKIVKFKKQMLSIEGLIHAKYPFHRNWQPYLWGVLALPNYSKHASSQTNRFNVVDVYDLPSEIVLSQKILEDNVDDNERHYQNFLKTFFAEEGIALKAAKKEQRIIMSFPTEEK